MYHLLKRPLSVSCALFLVSLYICSLFVSPAKPIAAGVILLCAAVICALSFIRRSPVLGKARFAALVISLPLVVSLLLSYASFDAGCVKTSIKYAGRHSAEMVVTEQVYDESFYSVYRVCVTEIDGEPVKVRATLRTDFSSSYKNRDVITAPVTITPSSEGASLTERSDLSKGLILDLSCSDDNSVELAGARDVFPYTYIASARAYIVHMLSFVLDGEALSLAKALTVGDTSSLSFSTRTAFNTIGISHALAISGLHLGIFIASLTFLLSKAGVRRKARLLILLASGFIYVCILGFKPSVLRAYLMYCGLIASGFAKRNRDPVTTLFFSVSLICIIFPYSICDLGLHLSFFSTLGILTVALSAINAIGRRVRFRPAVYVVSAELACLSALLFTLPYEILCFEKLPLLAPVANLIFVPLITLLVYLAPLVFVSYFIPFLIAPVSFVFKAISGTVVFLAESVSGLTGGFALDLSGDLAVCAGIAAVVLALVFLLLFRKKRIALLPVFTYLAAVSVMTVVLSVSGAGGTEAYLRTNGSSDAIVVKDRDTTAVIDNSYGGYAFLSSVMSGSSSIISGDVDILVLTHYHEYSVTSLEKLIDRFRISSVVLIMPDGGDDTSYDYVYTLSSVAKRKGASCTVVREGERIGICGILLSVTLEKERFDHYSVSMTISGDQGAVLYTDARSVKNSADKEACDCDEVIIGSHGSDGVSLPAELFMSPRFRAAEDRMTIHISS